jgi:hypothetical protein
VKHNNEYRIYEINQNLINFLRGDGKYRNRPLSCIDKQIYSHYGEFKLHSDKYIGIIIEFQKQMFFAPLTHDGNKIWFKRDDTYDFEKIYDTRSNYVGSLLLCKALPLTHNLFKFLPLGEILKDEGEKYF